MLSSNKQLCVCMLVYEYLINVIVNDNGYYEFVLLNIVELLLSLWHIVTYNEHTNNTMHVHTPCKLLLWM